MGNKTNKDLITAENQEEELDSFDVIRTETVLSKFPLHNLSKQGKIEIDISKKGKNGASEVKWKVSPNPEFGEPGQTAYKLDTLIINRRIEEAGRPMPEYLKLGSLRDICTELGINTGGSAMQNVKDALLQNAFAAITAKFTYTAIDGKRNTLEAGFTRYTVIFTGESLPDGNAADAVYIIPNPLYRDILNSAQVRPLNYDYLKALTPTAQRFYEILSYRIFAAFQQKSPQAAITYSDYCSFSAQTRYFDWEHVRKQMYKVHKPHLVSKYLSKVEFQPQPDDAGQPDWLMLYTAGAKAKSEYARFTSRKSATDLSPASAIRQRQAKNITPKTRRAAAVTTAITLLAKKTAAQAVPTHDPSPLIAALMERGVTARGARALLDALPASQSSCLPAQLEYADYLLAHAKHPIQNPAGFLVSLLRDNPAVPPHFKTLRQQEARAALEHSQAEEEARQTTLRYEYQSYRNQALEDAFAALSTEEQQNLYETEKSAFLAKYPMARGWTEETLRETLQATLLAQIEARVPLLDLATFSTRAAQPEPYTPFLPFGD